MLNGLWLRDSRVYVSDVGRSSGYRRYCHCDGISKMEEIRRKSI